MSHPLSLRLADVTIRRLGVRASRIHMPPRTLAQRYVEEGLRMFVHPQSLFDVALGQGARRHVYTAGADTEAPDSHIGQSQAQWMAHVVNCSAQRYCGRASPVIAGGCQLREAL